MDQLTHRIHLNLCMLIACMIPLWQKILPMLIVLLCLNWLVRGITVGFVRPEIAFCGNWLVLLYLFYGIGMLWTTHTATGWFDLEVKLSFLVFPVLFTTRAAFSSEQVRWVLYAFLLGLVLSLLICNAQSAYHYFAEEADVYQFYGKYFSFHLHRGYYAMMINTGIALAALLLLKEWSRRGVWQRIGLIFLIAWFSFSLIQTSSKNGVLTLLFLYVFLGIGWIVVYRKYLYGILGVLVISGVFIAVLKYSPRTYYRFQNMVETLRRGNFDPVAIESTAIRAFAWESAGELILEHPLAGVGTGDVKEALLKKYTGKGYVANFEKKVNAHSQFLQTGAALGVMGLFLLLLVFGGLFRHARNARKPFLAYLVFIAALYATSESIFEVQAGVVFFVFFTMLLSSSEAPFPKTASTFRLRD